MKYGCVVTRMRKTQKIREALKQKGLTDNQIRYAKVWRFSNRVYTEEQLEWFKSQSQLPKDDRDYDGLRKSKLVDKNDFYSGNDYEYWVTPDGKLGSRDTGLPF